MREALWRWQFALWHALWRQRDGQDLIEYALLAGCGVVAAAAVLPGNINPLISRIFSTAVSQLSSAAASS